MYIQSFVQWRVKLTKKKTQNQPKPNKNTLREQLLNERLILFLHIQKKIHTRSMQLKYILIIPLTLV